MEAHELPSEHKVTTSPATSCVLPGAFTPLTCSMPPSHANPADLRAFACITPSCRPKASRKAASANF
eukprot:555509-Amphidinium_carterae.1